mmetsp:Transcript_6225/g.8976  ORF Transcript_6225/g.8976 Transcript_6225/m.8976 type:complete len:473 (+) Transcript_6225:807-2225(+)
MDSVVVMVWTEVVWMLILKSRHKKMPCWTIFQKKNLSWKSQRLRLKKEKQKEKMPKVRTRRERMARKKRTRKKRTTTVAVLWTMWKKQKRLTQRQPTRINQRHRNNSNVNKKVSKRAKAWTRLPLLEWLAAWPLELLARLVSILVDLADLDLEAVERKTWVSMSAVASWKVLVMLVSKILVSKIPVSKIQQRVSWTRTLPKQKTTCSKISKAKKRRRKKRVALVTTCKKNLKIWKARKSRQAISPKPRVPNSNNEVLAIPTTPMLPRAKRRAVVVLEVRFGAPPLELPQPPWLVLSVASLETMADIWIRYMVPSKIIKTNRKKKRRTKMKKARRQRAPGMEMPMWRTRRRKAASSVQREVSFRLLFKIISRAAHWEKSLETMLQNSLKMTWTTTKKNSKKRRKKTKMAQTRTTAMTRTDERRLATVVMMMTKTTENLPPEEPRTMTKVRESPRSKRRGAPSAALVGISSTLL